MITNQESSEDSNKKIDKDIKYPYWIDTVICNNVCEYKRPEIEHDCKYIPEKFNNYSFKSEFSLN